MEKKIILLPADDAVQNWFEENIDKECSASSAVYKFRLWLESLQVTQQTGAVWVKALKQLPPKPGEYHSKKHGKRFVMLFAEADRKMPKEYWEGVEWLDESPAAGREDAEIKRRTKIIEDMLKRDMRLNMPGISDVEQERTWQDFKKTNNL